MASDQDTLHSDLSELLTILGMGDHARPQSPHEVFQEALGVLRKRLAQAPGLPVDLIDAHGRVTLRHLTASTEATASNPSAGHQHHVFKSSNKHLACAVCGYPRSERLMHPLGAK